MQAADYFAPGLLAGRTALITGGATGIGREIAATFARLGAAVVLASRGEQRLAAAAAAIRDAGGSASHVVCDVREPAQVEAAVAAAVERHGGLDVLVANAAGAFLCPTAELSPNGWRTVVDIDLNGTFHCCRAAYPHLKASTHGGRIVSIVTTNAESGWPGAAHVAAAKAGIVSLSRTLASEWAADGILVNTIAPGPIAETAGVALLHADPARLEAARRRVALGRFGETADIAAMAAYLASPLGAYITGADLVVDGGRRWHRG